MPRQIESIQLDVPNTDPDPVRIHLLERTVVCTPARCDVRPRVLLMQAATGTQALAAREYRVRELRQLGYRPVTTLHYTVPAALAAAPDPDVLEREFAHAWTQSWLPTLAALAAARDADAGALTHVVLLPRFRARLDTVPWGALVEAGLAGLPAADKPSTAMRALGAGPNVTTWLSTYYFPALERALSTLPASAEDSDLVYSFALGIWDPTVRGPLAALAAALNTARNMAGSGLD